MMSVSQHVCELSPSSPHPEVASALEANLAQNRRVISRFAKAFESPESFRLFAMYQEDAVVGVLCYELSTSYICAAGDVTLESARNVLQMLSNELGTVFRRLRGCDGPPGAVDAIATACREMFSCSAQSTDTLETMVLDTEPIAALGVPGVLRPVAPRSKLLPILALWFEQFEKDTDNVCYSEGRNEILHDLSEAAGRQDLYTWEVKEKPVAMAILGRTQPKQLICVYTPPHQRGRGYGRAVTAGICAERWRITEGTQPITLSAVHKFGAARVYERVGFRSVGWLHGVTFLDCPSDADASKRQADVGEKCGSADTDLDTDVGTDWTACGETDLETDEEISEADDVEFMGDFEADCWDLETDPAKLFASCSELCVSDVSWSSKTLLH